MYVCMYVYINYHVLLYIDLLANERRVMFRGGVVMFLLFGCPFVRRIISNASHPVVL